MADDLSSGSVGTQLGVNARQPADVRPRAVCPQGADFRPSGGRTSGGAGAKQSLSPADGVVLVTTTRSLIGRFAGVPDGAVLRLDTRCPSPSGVARINYTTHTATATLLNDTTPPASQIEALLLSHSPRRKRPAGSLRS